MLPFAQNNFWKTMLIWRRVFLVTLVFVTGASLLFWLDAFRVSQAEMHVLVIGKTSAVSVDQVADALSDVSRTLSFYNRVIARHDLIDDPYPDASKDTRKAGWNSMAEVTSDAQGGALTIRVWRTEPEQSTALAWGTVQQLLAEAAFYYNLKTDVDIRITDEPIVTTVVRHPFLYGATSFGSALLVTMLFFTILMFTPLLFRKRKSAAEETTLPYIDPQTFVPARPTNLSFAPSELPVNKEVLPTVPETSALEQSQSVVVAPGSNFGDQPIVEAGERFLPGMDMTELPFQFEETYPEEPKQEETVPEPAAQPEAVNVEEPKPTFKPEEPVIADTWQREPTIEEYKRRLNELLAGGK